MDTANEIKAGDTVYCEGEFGLVERAYYSAASDCQVLLVSWEAPKRTGYIEASKVQHASSGPH